ncbi:hypothetical protein EV360DRAFT_83450 [Lentinula raphanica]|nr:hypothetical protein EV360DRAFT_83450 [Lentinula raphanica]
MLPPGPDLIASFSAQHPHQDQSPLFTQIPPEIRNTILLYALLIYEDLSTIYPDDTHYSRPGYRHALRIDPQLLRTCRLVYLETRLLPLDAVDEHVFWCHRAPPGIKFAGGQMGLVRLEEVVLELETIERDKEQIYAIADRVSKETITLNNGRILCAADNAIVRKEWIGPSRLPDLRYDQTSKTWVDRDEVAEQDVPDPGLKYCIVGVKWTVPRLQRVDVAVSFPRLTNTDHMFDSVSLRVPGKHGYLIAYEVTLNVR